MKLSLATAFLIAIGFATSAFSRSLTPYCTIYEIHPGETIENLSWAPDGSAFTYSLSDSPNHSYAYDSDCEFEDEVEHPGERASGLQARPIPSPDENWVAFILANSRIHLLNTEDWDESVVLTGHNDLPYSIHWSWDSRTLYSVGKDNRFREWDVATGREKNVIHFPVLAMANAQTTFFWHPNERIVGFGGTDGKIYILDRYARTASSIDPGFPPPARVFWSSDGAYVGANPDTSAWPHEGGSVWKVATRQKVFSAAANEEIQGWSPVDSKFLTVVHHGRDDHTIRLRDSVHFGVQFEIPHTPYRDIQWAGEGGYIWSTAMLNHPRRHQAISIWDVSTQNLVLDSADFSQTVQNVQLSPDGAEILTLGSSSQTIDVWETDGEE